MSQTKQPKPHAQDTPSTKSSPRAATRKEAAEATSTQTIDGVRGNRDVSNDDIKKPIFEQNKTTTRV